MTADEVAPDLAAWLLEQIAKDEQRARDAAESVPCQESVPVGQRWTGDGGLVCGEPRRWCTFEDYAPPLWDCEGSGSLCMPEEASQHVATWDPARVQAECDAKRRIIGDIVPKVDQMDDQIAGEWGGGADYVGEDLLKLLALPYADRDGHREEWRL